MLIVHRLMNVLSEKIAPLDLFWRSRWGVLCSWLLTQSLVFVAWIWFRLPNLSQSNLVFSHLWGYARDAQFATKVYVESIKLTDSQILLTLVALTISMVIAYTFDRLLKLNLNWHLKLVLIPVCLYIVSLLSPAESLAFIYFDF